MAGAAAPLKFRLYTREACPLCEEMCQDLALACADRPFEMDLVDITQDPVLLVRWGHHIPVLFLREREVCRHRFDAAALRILLEADPA